MGEAMTEVRGLRKTRHDQGDYEAERGGYGQSTVERSL